ncbi:unnamed protein product [Rotaria sp. Silwood1]|nr:unnamed protein product [Rotaria sp. Silwood1]
MKRMMVTNFECLPDDVLFEIFGYLSPVNILQSFFSLNKRFSTILIYQYLWHIHIDDSTMSLTMFKDFCQNVLKLVGRRVLSLRIRLNNFIGGWSLVSSSLKNQQITLLRHLHLIDIKPHEFDKLLYDRLVCSQLPNLRTCRLPFDFCPTQRYHLPEFSAPPLMTLPNLSNTVHLHTLTTGVNTIRFLERLVTCIPSIQNLSVGVQDSIVFDNDEFDLIPLPVAIDGFLLPRLSRLSMSCMDKRSFHRAVALLSSVFIQLTHLSLKLFACTSISGPLFILGDTIQKLCIDRLKTSATYTLNLSIYVKNDLEKIIFNSFLKAPFTRRERLKVLIQKGDSWVTGDDCYDLVIQSFGIRDGMLTSRKAKDVCMLLCNRFPNLKEFSFTIYESWDFSTASPSYLADYKNESTKRIVNLIHFLVDHLQQLVSFHMNFIRSRSCETPCFPHLIRRQLHEWLLNRPYRLRCSTEEIQLWL